MIENKTNDAKANNSSPTPSRLMPSQPPSNGYHAKIPPLCFITEHDVIWHGISLLSVRIICPGCITSQLLVHPKFTHWGEELETLTLQCCARTGEKLLLYYHLCFSHKFKTQYITGCYEENKLHLRQIQHRIKLREPLSVVNCEYDTVKSKCTGVFQIYMVFLQCLKSLLWQIQHREK